MLDSLRFVQGAVAQKSHVPILKHFKIEDGRIQSHNGVIGLNAPIECDLSIQPLASTFVHAITLCDETVALHETDAGRLAINSGCFKAFIDTSDEPFPATVPQGELVRAENLLQAIQVLAPIMSDDASRPWSRGILFYENSAFVTNNIILVEHWLDVPVSRPFGLPVMAVNELLRIGEEPERIQISHNQVTFHFSGDRWLSSSLLIINQWPDVRELLENPGGSELCQLHESLFTTLQKLRPFTKDLRPVWLHDDVISTSSVEDDGAHYAMIDGNGMSGIWSLDHLARLQGLATEIDWSRYPKPCPFFGPLIRGVIIGIANA
jgi:DNA polymerase III sliding clamp (beta) subunit (PCNA family)